MWAVYCFNCIVFIRFAYVAMKQPVWGLCEPKSMMYHSSHYIFCVHSLFPTELRLNGWDDFFWMYTIIKMIKFHSKIYILSFSMQLIFFLFFFWIYKIFSWCFMHSNSVCHFYGNETKIYWNIKEILPIITVSCEMCCNVCICWK